MTKVYTSLRAIEGCCALCAEKPGAVSNVSSLFTLILMCQSTGKKAALNNHQQWHVFFLWANCGSCAECWDVSCILVTLFFWLYGKSRTQCLHKPCVTYKIFLFFYFICILVDHHMCLSKSGIIHVLNFFNHLLNFLLDNVLTEGYSFLLQCRKCEDRSYNQSSCAILFKPCWSSFLSRYARVTVYSVLPSVLNI